MISPMSENDYKLFCSLVKSKQATLLKGLHKTLKQMFPKESICYTKNYLYAKGTIPILLVAHCDTVFKELPKRVFYDRQQRVMWSPQGLGADDRAGVFSILTLLREGFRPSVLFTTDEEIGGLGAMAFIKDFPKPDKNYKYVIELDRQGECDAVFYDCDNKDFVDYVEQFGFIEDWGTFTDISIICPIWKIAGVNLSVGYLDEHSKQEILQTNALYSTIKKVKNMLNAANLCREFEYIPAVYSLSTRFAYGWGPYEEMTYLKEDDLYNCLCSKCHKTYARSDCIEVRKRGMPNAWSYYCYNCLDDENIDWCEFCGNAFEKEYSTQKICEACGGLNNFETISIGSRTN